MYEPLERQWFHEAIIGLPEDITIMCKNTPHEFNPYYPFEPMFGTFGQRKQIVEMDLCHENAACRDVPFCQVEYIAATLDYVESKGVTGILGRAHFNERQGFHTVDEINLYGFGRLSKVPTPSAEDIWRDWACAQYPEEAVPHILRALKQTFEINRMTRYHLRFWAYPWKGYRYAYGKILQRSNYKWTHDEKDLEMQEALYHPSDQLFADLLTEKDRALQMTKECLEDLDRAARYMDSALFDTIRKRFLGLLDAVQVQRAYTQAFFGVLRWMDDPGPEKEMVVREAIMELRWLRNLPDRPGRDYETGDRWRITENCKMYEALLADHGWALRVSEERLEQQRKYLKVVDN
jgi:hypothetical protein